MSDKVTISPTPNPTYTPIPISPTGYRDFEDFYPFYLGEHHHPTNRRLHLLGTTLSSLALTRALLAIIPASLGALALRSHPQSRFRDYALATQPLGLSKPWVLAMALGGVLQGYVLAWAGHFFVEGNRPATWRFPGWSLRGDWRMLWEVATRKRKA